MTDVQRNFLLHALPRAMQELQQAKSGTAPGKPAGIKGSINNRATWEAKIAARRARQRR